MPHVGWAWKSKKYRTYRLDFDALRAEVAERGLRYPVLIAIGHGGGRTQTTFGTHRFKRAGDKIIGGRAEFAHHQIHLLRHATAAQISETLHHELTHAEQMEADLDGFNADYRRNGRSGSAYRANPYEVEARAKAHERHALRPLAMER